MKKKNLLIPLLMAIVMMAMSPTKMWADGTFSGSGTQADPYQIATEAQLGEFRELVNAGNASYNAAYYQLTNDIDLSSVCHAADAANSIAEANWTPIGTSLSNAFKGTFDGGNHKITGLYIKYTTGNQGLFGYIYTATLKNFSVSGEMKSGTAGVAGIGGVVGTAQGNNATTSVITRVTNNVNITVDPGVVQDRIAGIAGDAFDVAITYCVNNGNIDAGATSNGKTVGGIAGYATSYGKIFYCLNNGQVKSTSDAFLGGILGYINTDTYKGVQGCLNLGTISQNSYNSAIIGYTKQGIGNSKSLYHSNCYLNTSAKRGYDQNSSTLTTNTATSVTTDQLSNGEACYLLNGKNSSNTFAWYQTLGTDMLPVLDNTHSKVYKNGANYVNQGAAAVFNGSNTLTFYYDNADHSSEGNVYEVLNGAIEPSWYSKKTDITTVVFDASFANARPESCYMWFCGFSNLTTITGISNLNTEYVTDMNRMFSGCSKLTSLDLSSLNTANVTNMSYMFCNCSSLQTLTLGSNFTTAEVTTMYQMFYGCSSLTSPDLSSFNTEKVTSMSYMFYGCSNLTSPDLSSFNTAEVRYMTNMFQDCSSLTSLNISNFNTANVTDMSKMFYGCSSLTSLTIGNFDMQQVTNTSTMFYTTTNLKTLNLKAVPYLKDQTFNSKFTGDGVTVNYQLDDNSVIYTGTNNLPAATAAPTYTRTIAAGSNWGTLVLPFEVKSDENVQLYTLSAVAGDKMTFSPVATVAVNTPCVFKKKAADATSVTFTANSATDAPAAATPAKPAAVNGLSIKGTYTVKTNQKGMYFIAQDKFWKADDAITINPFRAWFEGTVPAGAKSFNIVVEDEATGIDLTPTLSQGEGVGKYLENGKVVIVKNGKKYNLNGQVIK